MMNEVFIDASAWVAIFYPQDQNHAKAKHLWDALVEEDWSLVTTSWTAYEALTILKCHYRVEAARRLWQTLQRVELASGEHVEEQALDMFFRFQDKAWSVVDCANFETIRQRSCRQAFAFDRHFEQAGGQFGFELLY